MFEPGHWHRASLSGEADYSVDLYYEVRSDPREGQMVHFRMRGQVEGKAFEEEFELHRDTAFNFASVVTRIAARHGLPTEHSPIMRSHDEFDRMFEDIRAKLGTKPGEAVNFDHLERDRF
ncbi:DUF5064 family protein [Pseudomonas sp. CAU 1711]|uniref:DUF5064 family protein n=1 Tax=Pseudomonas sp. CAU 1711 TaxID=3140356 RepID=UPI00326038C7